MGRLLQISLFVTAVLSQAEAQNASPTPPLPPAMRGAIDRMAKGTLGPAPFFLTQRSTLGPKTCSVPLLEMRVDHPEQFTMRKIPAPTNIDRGMPRVMPAPPCEQTALR